MSSSSCSMGPSSHCQLKVAMSSCVVFAQSSILRPLHQRLIILGSPWKEIPNDASYNQHLFASMQIQGAVFNNHSVYTTFMLQTHLPFARFGSKPTFSFWKGGYLKALLECPTITYECSSPSFVIKVHLPSDRLILHTGRQPCQFFWHQGVLKV